MKFDANQDQHASEAEWADEPIGGSTIGDPTDSRSETENSDDELVVVTLDDEVDEQPPVSKPKLCGVQKSRSKSKAKGKAKSKPKARQFTAAQRLLILDCWTRSGLDAKDFAPLVCCSPAALYKWKRRFEEHGPAGLEKQHGGQRHGNKLPEVVRRSILMLKQMHPDWGQERIHFELLRTQGLQASASTVGKVLEEGGHTAPPRRAKPHPDKVRRFERARPNQLWQTDLFTFTLKRQNRRVHLVAFMDDHSRFVVGFGLHASASGALVREVFEAAIASYGRPEEILTDNGSQYVTWRGKSAFTKLCERRGIKQIVARPRRPQTLGKVERFWGSLWRECLESAVFLDLEDARRRIGLFMDHYNFHRTHQGIGGLYPADRFFSSAPEVKETLAKRVASNALELARDGLPRKDFYLTGRVGDVGISLHAEGEQVILTSEDGTREAVNLSATGLRGADDQPDALPEPVTSSVPSSGPGQEEPPAPGTSPLDDVLIDLDTILDEAEGHDAATTDAQPEADATPTASADEEA